MDRRRRNRGWSDIGSTQLKDRSQVPWGAILFIAVEAMFFAALFTAYFYLRTRIPVWQPLFGEKPTWLGLPTVNTIELLVSGVTMQLAVESIKRDDLARVRVLLIVTMLLGSAFIVGQIYDFTHLGFLPTDSIFGSTFFLLTGFHGAHVIGGLLLLGYCTIRAFNGQWSSHRRLGLEGASYYWQFIGVVWIGLFATIYVIG